MRIVMLTSAYLDVCVGGVESHVYEVSRELVARGHDVLVVRTSPGPSVHVPPGDVPLLVLDPRPAGRKLPVEALRRLADGSRAARRAGGVPHADVLHFHDLSEAYPLARRLRHRSGARLVWTNHLGEFLVMAGTGLGRAASRRLTRPYVVGSGPSRELARQDACTPPMAFVPNGYDPRRFHPLDGRARAALRESYDVRPDQQVVLVPRRWAPNKGVLHLARALAGWRPAGAPLVLFVGGGADRYPGYQREVEATLAQASVECRVVGAVPTEEMPALYQLADLTVIPSLREATSLSALESMGCGVPVLGTAVGGLVDIASLLTGPLGAAALTLVPPADPLALRQALERLVGGAARHQPDSAARLAAATAQTFSWSAVTDRVEPLYGVLATADHPARAAA